MSSDDDEHTPSHVPSKIRSPQEINIELLKLELERCRDRIRVLEREMHHLADRVADLERNVKQ